MKHVVVIACVAVVAVGSAGLRAQDKNAKSVSFTGCVESGSAGTYTLTARVAADGPGGTFHIEFGGKDVTGPLTIPDTGGWQSWTNVSATVTLAAGVQSMRVIVDRTGATGIVGNLNYVRLQGATP